MSALNEKSFNHKHHWTKIGFLNLLEHFFVRAGDSLATLMVIWMLSPEEFGAVAIAGAWVAPCLLLFVSPETVFFRDFHTLQQSRDGSLARTLSTFRIFGWLKGLAAIGLAVTLTPLVPHGDSNTLPAMIWAFCFFSAAHVSGADREFLRVSKKMGLLNRMSLLQKIILIAGLSAVAGTGDLSALTALAWIGVVWLFVSAGIFAWAGMRSVDPSIRFAFSISDLRKTLKNFSLWHHLGGIIQQLVLMLDLFFLSFTGASKALLGLYGIGLKITNLLLALPLTIQSTVMVWIGNKSENRDHASERRRVLQVCAALAGILAVLSVIIVGIHPWILSVLLAKNLGEFQPSDIQAFGQWLIFFLSGGVLVSAGYPLVAFLHLRTSPKAVVMKLLLPWGILTTLCYAGLILGFGVTGAAWGNLGAGLLFWGAVGTSFEFKDSKL